MKILSPTPENLDVAAKAIREGKLVILPTETVYGIAADVNNTNALKRIFEAKRRPSDNPLIIHIGLPSQLEHFSNVNNQYLQKIIKAFWPGPMTVVLPKNDSVSDIISGTLSTVAIRIPGHPTTQKLLSEHQLAVAMPSANIFMGLSPTHIGMLDPKLLENVEYVIDGGACTSGIESTVLDLTSTPIVLRPGTITQVEIERVLGLPIEVFNGESRKSPGMYKRHYAPKSRAILIAAKLESRPGITFSVPKNLHQIQLESDPKEYAKELYAALYKLDQFNLGEFFIESPPDSVEWFGVWDRLRKATFN
jgi:L-threonylcarbamoyladenylate synthase